MKKLLAIALLAFSSGSAAWAQSTETATATATLIAPIAIANQADMNFGNVAGSGTAGTVVLAPDGTRTVTGGASLPAVTGTVSAATFGVTGEGTSTYAITLPSTDYIITETFGGSATMVVKSFTSSPSGTGALTAGAQTLYVGATLHVAAGQIGGVYTNATGFDVTVNYN